MNKIKKISVLDIGAVGDGVTDDSVIIQKALDMDVDIVEIPEGNYRIINTLKVHSQTHIIAHKNARIFMCGETPRYRGDFLLSNSDVKTGNNNITVTGGIWDGNNTGRCITKPDLFDKNGYSGSVLNFVNVKNLKLSDFIVANSVTFNIRLALIEDFTVQNIGFFSQEFGFNQDGLHIGGGVRNGLIENITALSKGQTNDDMIALNADDSIERVENLDLVQDKIENLTIRNVFAEDCFTFVRMLSVNSAIRNIKIENMKGGCRNYAINMDAARYCMTPLFNDKDRPNGVGIIDNIEINNMHVHYTKHSNAKALILCETNLNNFMIDDFKRDMHKDCSPDTPTIIITNIIDTDVCFASLNEMQMRELGECERSKCAHNRKRCVLKRINKKSDIIAIHGTFEYLKV